MFPYITTRNDSDVLTKGYIIVVFVVKETLKSRKGIIMDKFLVILMLLTLGACAEVPYEQRGSSAISYEEIRERADSMRTITLTLAQLGINKSRPQENLLNREMRENYSCRDRTITTPKGRIDVALCIPSWYWTLPSSAQITFVYQSDISERMPLSRVIYLEINHLHQWDYQRPVRRECPYTGPLLRTEHCRGRYIS